MKRIVAVLLVTLMLAAMFCGCVEDVGKETVGKEMTETTTSVPETTETPKDTTFGINETAVFENIKITATELKESQGEQFFEPEAGNVFVGVHFTIENISEEAQNISSILLFDAYVDGVKCDYSFTANTAFDEGTLDGEIASGKKMVGWYAIEVAQDWQELELQVKSEWLSDTKATFLFENK